MEKNEVSIDEVIGTRKAFARDDGALAKGVFKAPSFNNESREAVFVMSTEEPDSMRDIVVQAGMDTVSRFSANPVVLFAHNSRDLPIGQWKDVNVVAAGRPKRTEGTAVLMPKGESSRVDEIATSIRHGHLRGASIGFMPKKAERINDKEGNWTGGYRYLESTLLECSIVSIPANAGCLRKGAPDNLELMGIEFIEYALDNYDRDPVTKLIMPRAPLEQQLLDATGRKTFSFGKDGRLPVLRDASGKVIVPIWDGLPHHVAEKVSKALEGEDAVVNLFREAKEKAGDEDEPQETEGAVKPNPVDQEKQKAIDVVREHALQSKEPRLFARLMKALTRPADAEMQTNAVEDDDDEEAVIKTDLNSAEMQTLKAAVEARLASAKSIHSAIESGSGR